MMRTQVSAALGLLAALAVSQSSTAAAQVIAPPADTPSAESKEEARSHFDLGVSHFDREEWGAALAEFLKSRELYPAKGNTKNAAICLRKVGRFDEALDLFEALLRDFPDLSPTDRALAEHELKELQASVGTIEVLDAPAEAMVTVDGVARGRAPLAGPIRLAAGGHSVRVSLEGALPFEQHVELTGRQAAVVHARLAPLMRAGRLRVTEHDGRPIEVIVDGAVVGTTPWEGALAPGAHTVLSRGPGTLGTAPVEIAVRVDQVTTLDLRAADLPALLRVDAKPEAAQVVVDGVPVGRGGWEGRLEAGPHHVVVSLDGYAPFVRDASLGTAREAMIAALQPAAAERGHLALELDGGVPLGVVWGGDVASGCTAPCSRSLPVGASGQVHMTYRTPSGFGVGLQAGYLLVVESVTGRPDSLHVMGYGPVSGASSDTLRLSGLSAGAHADYMTRSAWPVTLRLALGVVVGSVRDQRTSTFTGMGAVDVAQRVGASYLYVGPEVAVGRRLGEHVVVRAGVELLILSALSTPQWQNPLVVTAKGEGTLPTAALTGSLVLAATPEIGVQYEF
jgi:hypothetical protein